MFGKRDALMWNIGDVLLHWLENAAGEVGVLQAACLSCAEQKPYGISFYKRPLFSRFSGHVLLLCASWVFNFIVSITHNSHHFPRPNLALLSRSPTSSRSSSRLMLSQRSVRQARDPSTRAEKVSFSGSSMTRTLVCLNAPQQAWEQSLIYSAVLFRSHYQAQGCFWRMCENHIKRGPTY